MFITTGFDELERKLQRLVDRLHVRLEQRSLTKAEINLGTLGWQQVDDFPPEVEEQMRAIHAMELQQTDLSNQSADIQWHLGSLELQRKQLRKDLDDLLTRLEPALHSLGESREHAEKSIPTGQENIHRFDGAISELETACELLAEQIRSLMMEKQTLHIREMTIRLGEKKVAYENEQTDLQRSRMKVSMDLKTFAQQIETDGAQIQEVTRQIQGAKDEFETRDADLLVQIDFLEKQKEHASKSVTTLDQKKSPAFLSIGRCLADCSIAPMNQPEALDHVFAHREKISSLRQRIENSLARSSQIPSSTLLVFYTTMIAFSVTIFIVAILFLRLHPHQ